MPVKQILALPRGPGAGWRLFFTIAACVSLLATSDGMAQSVRKLAEAKDWELVMTEDPFAEIAKQCQVRTRTSASGGRRERPLVIFDMTSKRITVRPDFALQGAIQANRALQGSRGDRGGRNTVLVKHGIRIDSGKLHSIEMQDTGSGNLEAHFDGDVYLALAEEASNGKVLFYLWSVASSRKSFQFQMDGLRELRPTAEQECSKSGGS